MSKLLVMSEGKKLFEMKGQSIDFSTSSHEELIHLKETMNNLHYKNIDMASEINFLKAQIRANNLFVRMITFFFITILGYRFFFMNDKMI